MKLLAITLIPCGPDSVTEIQPSKTERRRSVVDNAVLSEELNFGFYSFRRGQSEPAGLNNGLGSAAF